MEEDKTGVLIERQEFFDSFALDVAGIGKRHDVHTCEDKSCGHPAHGLSTGTTIAENKRAGDLHDGEGAVPFRVIHTKNMRTGEESERVEPYTARDVAYRPEVSRGGDEAIDAIDHDPDGCRILRCVMCNDVTEEMLQPAYAISRSGGGSKGRKRNDGCSPDFGTLMQRAATERMRYA